MGKKIVNDVVMVSYEFGKPLYVAPLQKMNIQVTDKAEEAETWHSQFDCVKLDYYKAVTGYELVFAPIPTVNN